jgi:2-dehydro-3-deoxygluconokinase
MQKVVSFGEVMLRISPQGRKRFNQTGLADIGFSGAEANVTAALSWWGLQGMHVTRFPDNGIGRAAKESLRVSGLETDFIQFGGERIGIYFVENGASVRPTTIIYDRLPSAFSTSGKGTYDWNRILDGVSWFHWTGITPALSQEAADALLEALEICADKGVVVSGDINYRSGLWRYGKTAGAVMEPLVSRSQVIIAGENDTRTIFGIEASPEEGHPFVSISRKMMRRFDSIRYMVTSEREQISASHNKLKGLVWNGQELMVTGVYDINHIVERIGSGDAFAAGFIYARLSNWADQRAIDFATAAAVMKHSIEGDVVYASPVEIISLMEGGGNGRIVR